MKRGKSTTKQGNKVQQNAIRKSVRNRVIGTEQQGACQNESREQETRLNERRELETLVNETSEQQAHDVNEPLEHELEHENRVTDQIEDGVLNDNGDSDNDDQDNPTDEPARRRGPNHGANIPENQDERPTIIAIGGRFPDSRVTSDITVMLRSHFDGPWPTWSKVPEKMKENLWAKFTKHYKWSSWRHHQIRKAWETTNSNRFRDILCEERKRAEILVNSNVPANWKNRNPNWIPRKYWNLLIDNVWSTVEWQKRSTSGKKNRIMGNEKAEPTYTGGSIPIEAHKVKMRKELNREPTAIELYDRTHKKNRGTGDYVCPKAKRVRETYEKSIEENYSHPETRPSFDPSMWRVASGELSNKKLYGFGPSRRGVGNLYNGSSAVGECSLEGEAYDKKIIDVEKMVEDVKLKTEGSIKEAKDEIVKFKKELPGMLRTILIDLYSGGFDEEYSGSDESEEYSYDRVAKMPRKHRVYSNRFDDYDDDDDDDDDNVYEDVARYKKNKGGDGKKRCLSNGKNFQQNRKQKK